MNVSNFVKICQVLTILHQFICRGSLILGHGVYRKTAWVAEQSPNS